ncbi:MAG: phosphatase PAP2 family protein [Bryobacteraceae bacterium]|nr:phosphatase PAP2 family protein [Bryobacteraceae bacterium]
MNNAQYDEFKLPLLPYGEMTDGLQGHLTNFPEVPPDFDFGAYADEAARLASWLKWRSETIGLIAHNLWPTWIPQSEDWQGASKDKMTALTKTDIHLTIKLWHSMLKVKPVTPSPSADCPQHIKFYRQEDDGDWFEFYTHYDTVLDPKILHLLREVYDTRAFDKCSSAHLQFKVPFQRPRPFHAAFLVKISGLRPLRAISSGSPSLCSGHALQALLGIGAMVEHVVLNKIDIHPSSHLALRQLAVDIGDRRVFAGVHYPSDNIASWIIAMRLANRVFRTEKVKQWLWTAILKQSKVYDTVQADDVYKPALSVLKDSVAGVVPLEE